MVGALTEVGRDIGRGWTACESVTLRNGHVPELGLATVTTMSRDPRLRNNTSWIRGIEVGLLHIEVSP